MSAACLYPAPVDKQRDLIAILHGADWANNETGKTIIDDWLLVAG